MEGGVYITSGDERGQGSGHEVKTLAFSLDTFSVEERHDISDVLQEAL